MDLLDYDTCLDMFRFALSMTSLRDLPSIRILLRTSGPNCLTIKCPGQILKRIAWWLLASQWLRGCWTPGLQKMSPRGTLETSVRIDWESQEYQGQGCQLAILTPPSSSPWRQPSPIWSRCSHIYSVKDFLSYSIGFNWPRSPTDRKGRCLLRYFRG